MKMQEQISKPQYSPTDWHIQCWNKIPEVCLKVNCRRQKDPNTPKREMYQSVVRYRTGPVFTKILILRISLILIIFLRKILRIRIFLFTKILIFRIIPILRSILRMVFILRIFLRIRICYSKNSYS